MIHLDFETYSELDVTVVGAYRYAEHPSTEVLVACWAIDDGAVARWVPHLHGPRMPAALRSAVLAGHHVSAHNVQFERAIWRSVLTQRQGWVAVPLHRWHCTAARAAAVGFPRSLADAAIAAELPAEYLKDKRGKELIKLFCGPRKPTKTDKRTRMLPDDNPGAFEDFCDYCAQDVVAERALDAYLPPLPRRERAVFMADIQINETGMPLDTDLLQKCESVVRDIEAGIDNRTKELTGGLRPTQRDKLIEWLHANGCTLPDLTLDTVRNAVDGKGDIYLTDNVREVLELRIEASRASTKKLHAMRTCASPADGRVRGAYLYGGAHTLRWTSRQLQLHNFVRGLEDPEEIATVLDAFRTGDTAFVQALYPNPMFMLSKCIRGFIAARPGYMLEVMDYSQIEARDLDWHAGNQRGLDEWASGVDKYKLMAGRIYGKDPSEVSDEERRIGKNSTLGCGFGMSAAAFLVYCHNLGIMDVTEDLAQLAVHTYREANHENVAWWAAVENTARAAIANPGKAYTLRECTFEMVRHWLTIMLPSGRAIWYPKARMEVSKTRWGKKTEQIVFDGANHKEHTYGAKLVENIVQATCRDIMIHGVMHAMRAGRTAVGHTHDEGIFETPADRVNLAELRQLMCELPEWSAGLPIAAAGFAGKFYRKG